MITRACCVATLALLLLGTGLLSAQQPPTSTYDSMKAVFNICASNARTGIVMTEQQVLAEVDFDYANEQGLNPQNFEFSFEIKEDFGCAVWVEAGHYDPREFRAAVEAYLPMLSEGAKDPGCVWRGVFPRIACVRSSERIVHPNKWEFVFWISFEIVAHKYAAMIVRPTLIYEPSGIVQIPIK